MRLQSNFIYMVNKGNTLIYCYSITRIILFTLWFWQCLLQNKKTIFNLIVYQANAIQEKIGFPDYIMNDTALDLEHEGVRKTSIIRHKEFCFFQNSEYQNIRISENQRSEYQNSFLIRHDLNF